MMKRRVLVVDDDEPVRESLKKLLQEAGYEVLLAADGQEAGVWCQSAPVDLLVLDLSLPQGSGWEVLQHLRTLQPGVPVIITTALPDQGRAARAAGASALMEKPIEVPALLKTVDDLLADQRCVA
jgi:CheY-like chemotaxis protein